MLIADFYRALPDPEPFWIGPQAVSTRHVSGRTRAVGTGVDWRDGAGLGIAVAATTAVATGVGLDA